MDKPQRKREIAIDSISKAGGFISFYANQAAIDDFRDFGWIDEAHPPRYTIYLDARYDFDEVLAYIQDYESSPIPDAFKDA